MFICNINRKFLFVVVIFLTVFMLAIPAQAEERTGVIVEKSLAPVLLSHTPLNSFVGALLTQPQAINLCLDNDQPINAVLTTDNVNQAEEFFSSLQGMPTASGRFIGLSSGDATLAAGTFTTFNSFNYGGSPDTATLSFDCAACPTGRSQVSIDWTYCTEENPTYLASQFQDPASVSISGSIGGAAFDQLFVDTAAPLSNAPGGSSTVPVAPGPTPDDVVYNACLEPLNRPRTVTANILGDTSFILEVADASDDNIDTIAFYDNVVINCRLDIDLKPGSNPNCMNVDHGGGNTAVAIYGSAYFDVTTVDPASVTFDGASPLRWAVEDANFDGFDDLVFHFKKKDLDSWEDAPENCREVHLTAELFDGTPVSGTDVLCRPGGENCEGEIPTNNPF